MDPFQQLLEPSSLSFLPRSRVGTVNMASANVLDMEKGLEELSHCLGDCAVTVDSFPPCAKSEAWTESKSRLGTSRKKLGILREVTSRKYLKVAFFGRTSSGKSSVINALLGEPVLPCGLGRTTACFVEIRATAEVSPCLLLPSQNNELDLVEVEPSSISTVVSSLSTRSYGPNTSVVLLWPRGLSPIFQESDVVLVDSPGIDVDADCDGWIDQFCRDADLFVWVVNGESTVNVREKEFFRRVADAISRPNVLVLVNRWDCTSEEEEYFIHAAHSQHVDRTCDLLVSRLGVAASTEEARRRMFFVSAREVIEERRRSQENLLDLSTDSACSVQVRLLEERKEEWDRFVSSILSCVSASARTSLRFAPQLETALAIARQSAKDMRTLEEQCASLLEGEATERKRRLEESVRSLEAGMAALTPMLKSEISALLERTEREAEAAFDAEAVQGSGAAVAAFEDVVVFHGDPASAIVYRDRLRRHVEEAVRRDLEARLCREVCCRVDGVQQAIVDRISDLIPEEKRDFLQVTPRRMPLELDFVLGSAALEDFVADLSFKSAMAPRRMLGKYRRLRRRFLSRLVDEEDGERTASPSKWLWLRQTLAVALLASFEASAVAGVALGATFLRGRVHWSPTLLSAALALSAAHACERALWTPAAKERELRRQLAAFADRRLRPLRPLLSAHCRSAAQKELASTLVLACGAAEGAGLELGREARRAAVDCARLRESAAAAARAAERTTQAEACLKELRDEALRA